MQIMRTASSQNEAAQWGGCPFQQYWKQQFILKKKLYAWLLTNIAEMISTKQCQLYCLLWRLADPGKIRWVLTVPAIWSDGAKQFMRESAYKVLVSLLSSHSLSSQYLTGQSGQSVQSTAVDHCSGTWSCCPVLCYSGFSRICSNISNSGKENPSSGNSFWVHCHRLWRWENPSIKHG